VRPAHVEGYRQGEWILVDYVDFVVHVFSEKARKFYDLERLWKTAKRLEPAELTPKTRTKPAPKTRTPRKRTPAATRRKKE
jgi:ribosome-associated protein